MGGGGGEPGHQRLVPASSVRFTVDQCSLFPGSRRDGCAAGPQHAIDRSRPQHRDKPWSLRARPAGGTLGPPPWECRPLMSTIRSIHLSNGSGAAPAGRSSRAPVRAEPRPEHEGRPRPARAADVGVADVWSRRCRRRRPSRGHPLPIIAAPPGRRRPPRPGGAAGSLGSARLRSFSSSLGLRRSGAAATGRPALPVRRCRPTAGAATPAPQPDGLAVLTGQVGQAGDGWVASDGGVWPVMVVPVQPAG
jgi:hypothetical protein